MSIVSAVVLFAVIWFMVLFIVLPIRLETQGDVGEHVPGTHSGAPASSFSMKKKARITTYWSLGLWVIISGVILFGGITPRDLDWFGRMDPVEAAE